MQHWRKAWLLVVFLTVALASGCIGGGSKQTFTLQIAVDGDGEVEPESGVFEKNAVVTIKVSPADGSFFQGWAGDHAGKVITVVDYNEYAIKMSSPRSIVAIFAQPDIESVVQPTPIQVSFGSTVDLPETVMANMSDGTTRDISVSWDPEAVDTLLEGEVELDGSLIGYHHNIKLVVTVLEDPVKYQEASDDDLTEAFKLANPDVDLDAVLEDLVLPRLFLFGDTVYAVEQWESNKTNYIGNDGTFVSQPSYGQMDTEVTLTATLHWLTILSEGEPQKDYNVMVRVPAATITALGGVEPIIASYSEEVLLPSTLLADISDGTTLDVGVVWDPDHIDSTIAGTMELIGTVDGYPGMPSLSVTVLEALVLDPAIPFEATLNQAYSYELSASGGLPPYDFSKTAGSLPNGLTLSGSSVTGTPSESGTFEFVMQVSDEVGKTDQYEFSLVVAGHVHPAMSSVSTDGEVPAGDDNVLIRLELKDEHGTPIRGEHQIRVSRDTPGDLMAQSSVILSNQGLGSCTLSMTTLGYYGDIAVEIDVEGTWIVVDHISVKILPGAVDGATSDVTRASEDWVSAGDASVTLFLEIKDTYGHAVSNDHLVRVSSISSGDWLESDNVFFDNDGTASIALSVAQGGVYTDVAVEVAVDGLWVVIGHFDVTLVTAEQHFVFDSVTREITGYDQSAGGRNVVIPSSIDGVPVTGIGLNAFGHKYIEHVVIPESVTNIKPQAFRYNHLTSLKIPSDVTSIGNSAFAYNRLTHVVIPDSVTDIGRKAFFGLSEDQIQLGGGVSSYVVLLSSADRVSVYGHIGTPDPHLNLVEAIPSDIQVTAISSQAFTDSGLESIVFPDTVTHIYSWAFQNNRLTDLVLPDSVEYIAFFAFRLNFLRTITIGSGVELADNVLTIGDQLREAYSIGGAGTYGGEQNGEWEKQD